MTAVFQNLDEGFTEFRENALSQYLRPAQVDMCKGSFMAGAQCTLILLQEGAQRMNDSNWTDEDYRKAVSELFGRLHAEITTYFTLLKMQGKTR